ncbi:hypothetical protein ACFPYJ_18145 [Paenibacillus solisilvae]|uniref:Uncharacterized protein n=1 Tax=Paenibacillus solisilvae TaxID=2486751 RepID=A0ABW0W3R2_9BACL
MSDQSLNSSQNPHFDTLVADKKVNYFKETLRDLTINEGVKPDEVKPEDIIQFFTQHGVSSKSAEVREYSNAGQLDEALQQGQMKRGMVWAARWMIVFSNTKDRIIPPRFYGTGIFLFAAISKCRFMRILLTGRENEF